MAKSKTDQFTADDAALLGDLDATVEAKAEVAYTPKEERIIAGFEDIQRFVREHGRSPQHGEDRDIFERLYAVRLDRIRASAECRELLAAFDKDGLIDTEASDDEPETDAHLLAELGMDGTSRESITSLKHVRAADERFARKSPDEIAQREPCKEFEAFSEQFEQVQSQIAMGERRTVPFKGRDNQKIERGDWYILDGQKALVAGASDPFKQEYGETDRRLRVIFDNGTESDMLMRSLRRALNKDEASRRILPPDEQVGPLFGGTLEQGDAASGTIYIARSLSEHPFVAEHRDVLHKIGVTRGDPKKRVAGANKDPTFLLADAELVHSFPLANLGAAKLENVLHKVFADARLDVDLKDRFGEAVEPREWFLVPLPTIEEAVDRIRDGTIGSYAYDVKTAKMRRV
jgi:hypothetical protein